MKAWVGAIFGTSVGEQEAPTHGGRWRCGFCISALLSVPTGDQGSPSSQAHRPSLLTVVNKWTEEAVGSPIVWLSHSIFSLILNVFFVVLFLLFLFFF